MTPEEMRTALDDARARYTDINDQNQAMLASGGEADDLLSDEDNTTFDSNLTQMTRLAANIGRLEKMIAAVAPISNGRKTISDEAVRASGGREPARTVPAAARTDPRTGGFRHLGEFAMCVRSANMRDEAAHTRLVNALGMNEGIGEDGGFLVPAEFRDAIMKLVEGEDSLLALTDSSTTARNAVTQNIDKTTPWGTAGIQVYWEAEGQGPGATGSKTEPGTLRLNKLFARVDVSDELLDDAPQLDSYLRVKTPEVMNSTINLAIVQGNGVGKPLGIMTSAALVTVAKETSQPADTIMHRNLVNMMGRMYAPSWTRSRWLMHQDVWSQLPLISFRDVGAYPSTATGTAVPAYMPPSGISGAPFGTLFGRPIMVLEAMETIGDLGDIILADMRAYRTVTKASGPRVDTSIHLKFDTDETVYRFIFRLAGAPWWPSTISPRDGSNTRSPFVSLASR